MSRLRAEINGDEWLGYSTQLQSINDLYNLAGLHIQVSAGRQRPKSDHFKKPPSTQRKATTSVANFNLAGLAAQVNQ